MESSPKILTKSRQMLFPAQTPPVTIIETLGIEDPSEIDLPIIAAACGAIILEKPLTGCDARIIGSGDRAIITVRSDASPERKRFSGAHELGHWMRDRGKAVLSCENETFLKQWGTTNPEMTANRFAADLLLPRAMFQTRSKGTPITWASVKTLAKIFRTSLTATAIRLAELGELPGMLVCSSRGRREWFVRGRGVPDAFWPHEMIRNGSKASVLSNGRVGGTASGDVGADEWINRPDSDEFNIFEDSWKVTDSSTLSLLWWKNEYQIVKFLRGND
ncbi:MAG: ImmA/IrrE family metallo-endopeptidase [Bdellovibrionales bacterium]|nr:ImmA/IrrE family metallo-endopeptidase [Bdellovibrionales bacterium]